MSNQNTKPTNYAKLLGHEAIPDDKVAEIRHMEERLQDSDHESRQRRAGARRERVSTRRFRAGMAVLLAAAAGATYGLKSTVDGHPQGDSTPVEAVYPAHPLENSFMGKDGQVHMISDQHPAGAEISTVTADGHQAEGFVAWDQLTPAQQAEAKYEQTGHLESDQP